VGKEQVLGSRFGIDTIPIQVFFDKNGKEVLRHMGFYPQTEIEKKLSFLGVE
jgi:thioredoxin 1